MSSITVRFTLPTGAYFDAELPKITKLRKNFTLSEVANNLASERVKFVYDRSVAEFLDMVQELRDKIGSITVNSCYRTASFNRSCGGSANSLHLRALAMDCAMPRLTDARYAQVKLLWQTICAAHGRIGGINRYTNGVHIDGHEEQFGYKGFVERDYRGKKGDW